MILVRNGSLVYLGSRIDPAEVAIFGGNSIGDEISVLLDVGGEHHSNL